MMPLDWQENLQKKQDINERVKREADIKTWRMVLDDMKVYWPDEYEAKLKEFQTLYPGVSPDLE